MKTKGLGGEGDAEGCGKEEAMEEQEREQRKRGVERVAGEDRRVNGQRLSFRK